MTSKLQPEHPDFDAKPGDTREDRGRVWKFGQNQFSSYWVSGPKDGKVSCSKDYPHNSNCAYIAGGSMCIDFGAATTRAQKMAKGDYERALEIVTRYEAEEKSK